MKLRDRLLPYLIIAGLYLACTILVDPRGQFPLNDDWSYTRTAFRLASQNQMRVDEWSAPILVGQALYGALLAKLFGPSFLALRLSTILLSCAASCLLWSILRRLNIGTGLGWISVITWVFNPIWFCLSFTFMTEVPFLLVVVLSLRLLVGYLQQENSWSLIGCGIAIGYACLIRQTGLLFMIPIAIVLMLVHQDPDKRNGIKRLLVWGCGTAISLVPYFIWSLFHAGSTPAAHRKFELLSKITSEQLIGNSLGLAFYISFFALPVLVCLLPSLWRGLPNCSRALIATGAGCGIAAAGFGFWWFHTNFSGLAYLPSRPFHSRMPFLLNVLYDTGLGPVTLDPTYYGPPPTPTHPHIWLFVTLLVVAALAVLGIILTVGLRSMDWASTQPATKGLLIFSTLAVSGTACFEVVFSHLQEGGLFDRHILTVALPMTILLGCLQNCAFRAQRPHRGPQSAAWLLTAAAAWFSVCGTHDYLAWNRIRWNLGNELRATRVDPTTVSGGFEFNAWNNYDTFRARGNIGRVYHWWYDRPDYVIAMEPQENYLIQATGEYYSWLHHRRLSVHLLKKGNM